MTDHPNKSKCADFARSKCALKGGVCQCLSSPKVAAMTTYQCPHCGELAVDPSRLDDWRMSSTCRGLVEHVHEGIRYGAREVKIGVEVL